MSEHTKAVCPDGNTRTVHGVAGSRFVYADGRRVYGYVSTGTFGSVFTPSSTSKYAALVAAAAVSA